MEGTLPISPSQTLRSNLTHRHFKAHDAPVLQLAWSHPEYSNLLASCSYDRSVRIWEEVTVPHGAGGSAAGRPGGMPSAMTTTGAQQTMSVHGTPGKRWIECGLLMDARGSVRNLEFAPNAFGLKLVRGVPPLPWIRSADSHADRQQSQQTPTSEYTPASRRPSTTGN